MAERRMFAKTIIDSDAFLDMSVTARLLYYDLSMRADDDGFMNSPKKIMRMIGASEDDLRMLIARKFIIPFDNGVIVIKHWRIHNYIRKDTYNETPYKDQKAMLELDENNAYRLASTSRRRDVDEPSTQDRLGKDSIGKNIYIVPSEPVPYAEIIDYLNEKAGTKYKATSDKSQRCIKARFNESYTLEDFKTVIDKKSREWLGGEMEKFLRPETLFGPKFENYLNSRINEPKANKNAFTSHQGSDTTDYDALAKKIFIN